MTIAFRTTPEDSECIDQLVALSGKTKQDYIVKRLEYEDVTIVPSITVQKNLRVAMNRAYGELRLLVDIGQADEHLMRLSRSSSAPTPHSEPPSPPRSGPASTLTPPSSSRTRS